MLDTQKIEQIGQSNPIRCKNFTDSEGNPSGGYAHGVGITICWQDGPRGKLPDGSLNPANGAFVEDALVAARQRLEFFQNSKYKHTDNQEAMEHIGYAIEALRRRAFERKSRGVLGQHST